MIKTFWINLRPKIGFTLIELLVVISVIGLLSSIVLSSLNNARSNSRDTKRQADLANVRTALLGYHATYGALPITAAYGETDLGGWDRSTQDDDGDGNYFLDFLVDSGWLAGDVTDPINEGNYYYRYYCYNNNNGRVILAAIDLENGGYYEVIDEFGYNCSISSTLPHDQ